MIEINKALGFLLRDFRMNVSYRLSFFASFASIFVSVSIFYFVSSLFGEAVNPYLAQYNGDYFSFVLIGISFSGLVTTGLSAFSSSISKAQSQGTLEAMLVTPTGLPAIVLFSSLWSFLFNTLNVFLYLTFGNLFFGFSFSQANFVAAIVILILTAITFSGIGVISAGFVMVFKRGNPIDWLYGLTSSLLSGMYFPTDVLPSWLQPFSLLLPIFHALKAMRLAVLKGYPLAALTSEISALLLFAIVILPLSLFIFKRAVQEVKRDGSLATY